MKFQHFKKYLLLILIASVAVFFFFLYLTNEKDDERTLTIDMSHIKQQLSGNSNSSNSITGDGNAQGLLVGAIVINSRDTPYTNADLPLSESEEDALVDDLINSVNYITIANLPVSEDYIEFLIPPATAANWQIVVIAVDFKINTLSDLDSYEDKGEITHAGFTEEFYNSSSVGSQVIQVTMVDY